MCKLLFESLLSILGAIHPEVGLLQHMAILCLISEDLPCCFSQWLCHFTFPPFVPSLPIFLEGAHLWHEYWGTQARLYRGPRFP